MTQIELKREIENTREDLNAAIAGRMTESRILDISRLLDGLIEEYLSRNNSPDSQENMDMTYMDTGNRKGC